MIAPLIAYDADGNVTATLAYLVTQTPDGPALVDFAEIERQGGPLRLREDGSEGVWHSPRAVGSSTWPEWIDKPHEFTVETEGEGRSKRIVALKHKRTGHRRERRDIERRIAERVLAANGKPADIRDLVGGPERPLKLDAEGRTLPRRPRVISTLPVVAARALPAR